MSSATNAPLTIDELREIRDRYRRLAKELLRETETA